jgi:hypothetical protein
VALTPAPAGAIVSVAGPPVRGGERAMLFGPVVPDRVHSYDVAVDADLDRSGHDRHFHTATPPPIAHPVVGAGERHIPGGIHDPGDAQPVGGASRTAAALNRSGFSGGWVLPSAGLQVVWL